VTQKVALIMIRHRPNHRLNVLNPLLRLDGSVIAKSVSNAVKFRGGLFSLI